MTAMKNLAVGAMLLALAGGAFAAERGTADDAKKMVDEGLAHIAAVGPEQAFKDFSTPDSKQWHYKDIYLFCYKMDGTNVCHGANQALIGKNLIDLKTPDGQYLIKNMADLTITDVGGWVHYQWPHPQTKKMEAKSAWVIKVPGYDGFIGAGVYKE